MFRNSFSIGLTLVLTVSILKTSSGRSISMNAHSAVITALQSFKGKAKPTLATAPLDINETLNGELESLTQILGVVTGGVSGLVAGLTGVSLTNCASQIKSRGDLNSLTCKEFIDAVADCESLMYVKDLLKYAKKAYKKDPKSKKPCFK